MKIFRFLIVLIAFSICNTSASKAGVFSFKRGNQKEKDTVAYISPYHDDNERCLKCHGQARYEYTNETQGRQVRALMYSERIITREDFYRSNHKSFSCTDCHSEEYTKFPHAGELRMEPKLNCIDCHGGDESYASFHFEEIEADYKQSTHYKLEAEGFTCWSCHNPHTYRISIRNADIIKEAIAYDNAICLKCHSNYDYFQLLSERKEINIMKTHEWLPNQASHFKNLRCIECHTKTNDSVMVSHLILPKAEAVKRCNECHSQNSHLMATLYKFESKAQRRDGFFNGIILNQAYVIGANRNEYLNEMSIVIFGLCLLVIGGHTYFRIRKHRKDKEGY